MNWRQAGYKTHAYVNDWGRVCGTYEYGHRFWHAYCEGKDLGLFIDEESAKKAVENNYTQIPA